MNGWIPLPFMAKDYKISVHYTKYSLCSINHIRLDMLLPLNVLINLSYAGTLKKTLNEPSKSLKHI